MICPFDQTMMMHPAILPQQTQKELELVGAIYPSSTTEVDVVTCTNTNQRCKFDVPNDDLLNSSSSSADDAYDSSQEHHTAKMIISNTTSNSAARNYILAASTAVFLSLLCPQTKIWRTNNNDVDYRAVNIST